MNIILLLAVTGLSCQLSVVKCLFVQLKVNISDIYLQYVCVVVCCLNLCHCCDDFMLIVSLMHTILFLNINEVCLSIHCIL